MRTRIKFKPLGDKMLVTNDDGSWAAVSFDVFSKLFAGNIDSEVQKALEGTTFLTDRVDPNVSRELFNSSFKKYMNGPSRFVLKFTNACNYDCIYCQAGSCAKNADQMCTVETAKNVVDFAFQSSAECLTFEIQGGEPLMNFPVVKEFVEYIEQKRRNREVSVCMMSNLSLMTPDIAAFYKKHNISIGTSIDGPKEIMDKQRPKVDGGSSYDATQKGRDIVKSVFGYKPGFLSTISRDCLDKVNEIVDMSLDTDGHYNCRSLFYLGRCIDIWDEIGYSVDEALEYYKKAVMHCLDRQIAEHKVYYELRTAIFLAKIFERVCGDIEVNSPCGGVICMCSIDWNGDIMACEGSKMLQSPHREKFVLGNVNDPKCSYHNIYFNDNTLRILDSMVSQDDAKCSRCPYLPYCGRCAVEREMEDAYGMRECQINEGQLDFIFTLLQDPIYASELRKWVDAMLRRGC